MEDKQEISKIKIQDTVYEIKDQYVRELLFGKQASNSDENSEVNNDSKH